MVSKSLHSIHTHSHKPQPAALAGALAFIALSGATALWILLGSATQNDDPVETLVGQMVAAAHGESPPAFHALGGTLRTVYGNGRINVIASDVPASPCVKAGWRLAKLGTVIVNGVLPLKLSAAKLSELCEGGATLTWVPDP